jgi:hypothetical protein
MNKIVEIRFMLIDDIFNVNKVMMMKQRKSKKT